MRFSALLDVDDNKQATRGLASIPEAQREAGLRFPGVATEHGFPLVDRTRARPTLGKHTIVAVHAEWAVLDLALLDDLSASSRDWAREGVELLDVSSLEGSSYIEHLSPGCTATGNTPIVVVEVDGRVVRTEVGKPGRDFLRSMYLGRRDGGEDRSTGIAVAEGDTP